MKRPPWPLVVALVCLPVLAMQIGAASKPKPLADYRGRPVPDPVPALTVKDWQAIVKMQNEKIERLEWENEVLKGLKLEVMK